MFYPNLEAEMKRKGYTRDDIAKVLDVHVSSAFAMLSGRRTLSLRKAKRIRDNLFPGMPIEYLFDDSSEMDGVS